jgi:CBS domain containing-hemolysin-like protein
MSGFDIWLLVALVALIVAAAILGAAEAALLRVQRVRLEVAAESGDSRSARMLTLLDDLPRVLNTVLLVVLLVQISAATVAGAVAASVFGSLGITIASVALTFVLFVYSEAIPKTYAVHHPEAVARTTAPLLQFLSWLLRPVVSVLVRFADLQAPGTGIASPSAPTEQELLRLASDAAATGTIDESDRVLIDRAFFLGDQRVDDIYVPRLDVVAVQGASSVREAFDLAVATGHRRIPTYGRDIDDIQGVVRLSALTAALLASPSRPVAAIADEPLVVPESKKVIELLSDMRQKRTHFAVVVDEYGGTAGVVTIEDITERLLEPISSAGEHTSSDIEQVDAATWIATGTTDIDDLERALGLSLPRGEWNTVAGLVIANAGHIPSAGDSIETGSMQFTVLKASGNRVLSVQVTLL